MKHTTRTAVLAALFATQIAAIVYARFVETRFLCWAPYDQITFYRIEVDRNGRVLSQPEIAARYRLPPSGRDPRAIHNTLQGIAQFEVTYGRKDPVNVRVIYRVNGGPEETWRAPK